MKKSIILKVKSKTGWREIRKSVGQVLLGGLANRSREEVDRHLRELRSYGISTHAKIPMVMRVGVGLLTTDSRIEVQGEKTVGEVEYVFFLHGERLIVTVGSDHSDIELEKFSAKRAKQIAPKVLCPAAWYYDELEDHWDRLVLRSWIRKGGKKVLYQEGALAVLLPLKELLALMRQRSGKPLSDAVMFSGTITGTGGIEPSSRFWIELADPVLERRLSHAYSVESFPGYY